MTRSSGPQRPRYLRGMPQSKETARYFTSPAAWRGWLAKNHGGKTELWVGFHKRATGKPSLTWPQAVEQALAFGWIDGLRQSVDAERYRIRFTPRKPGSNWSAINVRTAERLIETGEMAPAGKAAFEARLAHRTAVYSFEQRQEAKLPPAMQRALRANAEAWAFFQAQPPWYRRTAAFWVTSAKKEETRELRFAQLLESSAAGRPIKPLTRPTGGGRAAG